MSIHRYRDLRLTDTDDFARMLVAYADETPNDDEFVIPEDLSPLTDEELAGLHEQAVKNFDDLFGDGAGLTDEALAALAILTEGIESLLAAMDVRAEAATERLEAATVLAERAHPKAEEPEPEAEEEVPEPEAVEEVPEVAIAASGRKDIRVNLAGLSRRQSVPPPSASPRTIKDVMRANGESTGYNPGSGVDWGDVGKIVDRHLSSFNASTYDSAARAGQHMRQQMGVMTIHKPIDPELNIISNDYNHVDEVMKHAVSESRLPGGSLLAAGGWCAPSEILYDLVETESRDGLFTVPEVGIARGGIQFTTGPSFAQIYAAVGFDGTEADDIAGNYVSSADPAVVTANTTGDKPCYFIECPDFEEVRLNYAGLCLSAGLLQQRGYPEVIARTTRGALVAHDHKMSVRVISAIVAGSDAVTMTAAQVGAIAPLLDAIEKQVEHYKYVSRLSRSTTLEAVFPYWIHGVVRSDLARRQGMNLLDVTDAQIDAWFTSRGISAQFVYDWQALTGAASAFTAWPSTVSFLLYAAGTWVKGTSDIITLDTIYDSVLLGQNNYTALFTEEGWLVAKRGFDSRVVTVALCPSGETAGGVDIACDGTEALSAP